ncbi:MAG TPA: arylsulfatase [Acidimicrobiales bacterium]
MAAPTARRAVIGPTISESTPAFAPVPRPAPGSPNVLVIVLDDLGFAQLGCYGSDIATPAIDGLAAGGVRYRRFHVTAMCSPTRACLLTGRNQHRVGMGFVADLPIGFPGYDGRIPRDAAAMPRLLRDAGYSTFAVGKWHLTPRWEQSAAGPFDRWPLGLGFERYYGFLNGDTNQWTPDLVSDNGFVDPPRGPDDGYHLTEDLADRAIRLVQDQQQATPGRPWFCYLATGAVHAPHQAPAAYIDAYRGQFDDGWEAWRARTFARQVAAGVVPEGTTLTERPPWVPDWDALHPAERRLYARMMEVYAGFLTHTDGQIGRVLDFLRTTGGLDDTLVLLVSDNGASAEGGPTGSFNEHRFTHDRVDDLADTLARAGDLGGSRAYNHYPWGWAWAGNTPFRLWKRYAWLGGVRTPLIAHWPAGIDPTSAGQVRDQFCHAVDLLPTVLDVTGVDAPAVVDGVDQQPLDGASLRATFDDAGAPSPRSTQYFEIIGSRAIVHDGWKATTDHIGAQISVERERVPGSHDFATDRWALFHLDTDFAEAHDVAGDHPERVADLERLWWHEAGLNQVLPLDDSLIGRAVAMVPRPFPAPARAVYRPGGGGVAEDFLPAMGGGFTLTATVEVPAGGGEGVVCALGDWNNGWAWYLLGGRQVATFFLFGAPHRVAAPAALAPGPHTLALTYRRVAAGGGPVALHADGATVAEAALPEDLPFRWQIGGAGLLVGRDAGFPVCDDYRPPFAFTGTLGTLVVEAGGSSTRPRRAGDEVVQARRRE